MLHVINGEQFDSYFLNCVKQLHKEHSLSAIAFKAVWSASIETFTSRGRLSNELMFKGSFYHTCTKSRASCKPFIYVLCVSYINVNSEFQHVSKHTSSFGGQRMWSDWTLAIARLQQLHGRVDQLHELFHFRSSGNGGTVVVNKFITEKGGLQAFLA